MYPLALRLAGLPVLVVGGGAVATRRVPALLEAGARVILVAPAVTAAIRALATAGRIELWERPFEPADVDGCWLVQVAVDDPAVARAVGQAAELRRVFCVRADDRAAATAWTPAVTRHGAVTVAVNAGGDPRTAAAVRTAIGEALLTGGLPVPETPTAGVALVGSGPGDPELITVRGLRLLSAAQVVVADRLIPGPLLSRLRPEAELVDASKIPYGAAMKQEQINEILIDRARSGKFVVRLKGGDPFVFGRGGEELAALVAEGIPVTVVPGVSSAIAVPAAAGIPVTQRGIAHEFTVVGGHLPPGHVQSLVNWSAIGRLRGTICVLMGLKNLPAIVGALRDAGRPPATAVAVVQEGTTSTQRAVYGTIATIVAKVSDADLQPPAVIVIGDVVSWSVT